MHIQQRVAAELERLTKEKTSLLDAARQRISGDNDNKNTTSSTKPKREAGLLDLPSVSPKDLFKTESEEEKKKKAASSKKVQDEIDKLQKALGDRKVLKDLPKEVEAARSEVVSCLRLKDRQALDCWKEVEVFKREVRKLEEQFVGKIL